MAIILKVEDNNLVGIEDLIYVLDAPTKDVRYGIVIKTNKLYLHGVNNEDNNRFSNKDEFDIDELVDVDGAAFSVDSLRSFLQKNVGNRSGGSDGSGVTPEDILAINQEIAATNQNVADVNQDINDLEANDVSLQEDIDDLEAGVNVLESDMIDVKNDIIDLENDKRDIDAQKNSVESDTDGNLQLVGDEDSPTKDKYYGTDVNGDKGFVDLPTQLISNSGRFYCYADNRWTTESDDVYGKNNFNFSESAGTGQDPNTEWEHQGIIIPEGKTLKAFHFGGRVNNTQVTDIEVCLILRKPNPITGWSSGFDNDAEDENIVVYRDLFMAPVNGGEVFTGNANDTHNRTIDLDLLVDAKSYLSIYIRPVGNITATRYFYSSYTYEIL